LKNFQQTLMEIFIAIMIAVENRFRIYQTVMKIFLPYPD